MTETTVYAMTCLECFEAYERAEMKSFTTCEEHRGYARVTGGTFADPREA